VSIEIIFILNKLWRNNMVSSIVQTINHFSDVVADSAVVAGLGYLCARIIQHVDPKVGIACGATVGAVSAFFGGDGANQTSRVVGFAALVFVPFKVCQKLNIATTFEASLVMTIASLVAPDFDSLIIKH
jgi:hypothetical protein